MYSALHLASMYSKEDTVKVFLTLNFASNLLLVVTESKPQEIGKTSFVKIF